MLGGGAEGKLAELFPMNVYPFTLIYIHPDSPERVPIHPKALQNRQKKQATVYLNKNLIISL